MRVLRFTNGGDPQYGVLENNELITVLNGDPLYNGIQKTITQLKLSEVRLLAPVLPRSKVVHVGKNFQDHAEEMGGGVPIEPLIFLTPNTAVIGPNETIVWPRISERIDFEGELVVVIGRICKDVPRERYKEVIFGYTIGNDITARDLQNRDGQWTRSKSFDTFKPIGPWIETDFDLASAELKTTVNGSVVQQDKLSNMIFDLPEIIHHITQVMTLLPGDIIYTGTPHGIGPLPEKSEVTVSISGIGELTNKVSGRG
jgi:2-keto-4-pentenoate hydratase/2-oxohepta-3-ene-1,7-dioic acid hydratase in catechol pathway